MRELVEVIKAEYLFVYGDVLRRKSALLALISYPYMLTTFILAIGYGLGGMSAFTERIGAQPLLFYISGSYLMLSILTVSDDLLWRPDFDHWMGTLPYVLLSPVNRLYRYIAIPLPRLTLVLILGITSVTPIFLVTHGVQGLLESLLVILMAFISSLTFIPMALLVMGSLYRSTGENWRVLNIIRPLLLILMGVTYPRFLMPWIARLITYLIPPSNTIEALQRFLISLQLDTYFWVLIGLATALSVLYLPVGIRSIDRWEEKLRWSGVKTE